MLYGITDRQQIKLLKKALRKAFTKRGTDHLTKPLWVEDRVVYDPDDEETCYIYGYIYGDRTDEELETWKECEWCYINSWYDCTGQWFTRYIHTHRNPNGRITFVHCKGLDV